MTNFSSQEETTSGESETFKILSRPTLMEMRAKYDKFYTENFSTMTVGSRKKFFLDNGWTVQEFVRQHRDKGIELPHD